MYPYHHDTSLVLHIPLIRLDLGNVRRVICYHPEHEDADVDEENCSQERVDAKLDVQSAWQDEREDQERQLYVLLRYIQNVH